MLMEQEYITISSKRKWFWMGVAIAIINPVFAGLILGAIYLSEPQLKKEGYIIAVVAIIIGALELYYAPQIMQIIQ